MKRYAYVLILKVFLKIKGMFLILKWKVKRKRWHDNNSRRKQLKKTKYKSYLKIKGKKEYNYNRKVFLNKSNSSFIRKSKNDIIINVPNNFSVKNNREDMAIFFREVFKKIERIKKDNTLFLNFTNVEFIGSQALMYLIALINNNYSVMKKCRIKGNFPKKDEARKRFFDTGFVDYVNMKKGNKYIIPRTDNVRILKGNIVEPTSAKKICDFISTNCGYTRIELQPLYEILIELMKNTINHAYNEKSLTAEKVWYLYAEIEDESVVFSFLDTGLGIPYTVSKKVGEKFVKTDSQFICSALKGDYNRSQTKLANRNKGLPQINENCRKEYFERTSIFSGKGYCKIDKNADDIICETDFSVELPGTLFSWKIKRRQTNA